MIGGKLTRGQLLLRPGVELHEKRRVIEHLDGGDGRRCVGSLLRHEEGAGIHELDRREALIDQCGQRLDGVAKAGEHEQSGRHVRQHLDSAERRLGDEGERSLAAHDEVGEDLCWRLEVEQRVQAVAHGVLHGELPPDLAHGLG